MARTAGAQPMLPSRVQAKVHQARALELRIEGHSQSDIAAQLSVNQSTVSRMIKRALAEREARDVDELRELEVRRTDHLHKLMMGHAKKGNIAAASVIARLLDRRARLLGLDLGGPGSGAGNGGEPQRFDYFATVVICTTDEAAQAIARAREAAGWQALTLHDMPADTVADITMPVTTASGLVEDEEVQAAATYAVRSLMPQPPLAMNVYLMARTYTSFSRGTNERPVVSSSSQQTADSEASVQHE